MSRIPNSAMPHAGPAEAETEDAGGRTWSQHAADLAELVREHPKAAIAAGAAVTAGVVAAAAIPLVRAARSKTDEAPPERKRSGNGRKKAGN